MPHAICTRFPMLAALLFIIMAGLVPTAAHAAVLDRPVRGVGAGQPGPAYASERIILRLRPEVAHAAHAEFAHERDPARRAALRPIRLHALSARLAGARLEPEFPGETPGASPDLTTFWIAHLGGRVPLESALDLARGSFEVVEASPIHLMPLDELTLSDLDPLGGAGPGPGSGTAAPRGGLHAAGPNDSLWGISYWLYQASRRDLHVLEAWDVTRGDSTSIIAVIDTGVLRHHPDLGGTVAGEYGNLWTNRAERFGTPGVDDDGNGYVDDVWGWDYVALDSAAVALPNEDWRDEDNDPNDFAVHGTAVAGVAAAIANNVTGTAGVAPGARIMALRIGYSSPYNAAGVVDLSYASRAILYAVRNGATVINCSFSSAQQPDLAAAVSAATAAGVLVIAAGGNNLSNHYLGDRNDVISVAATDQTDRVTFFSTRAFWVDMCAPGQSIATTTLRATGTDSIGRRTPHYSSAEAGTSFASPMVAAAAAMMQTDRRARGLPPYTPFLAQLRLTETADIISPPNNGTGFGTGRLNVQRVLMDPPLSTGFPAGARTIGPGVIVPTQSGAPWVAYATADSGLLIVNAIHGDTLMRVSLGSLPVGGIAAAELGRGLGTGLFLGLADGRIAGHFATGGPLPGWPVDATTTRGEFEAMPALGDLDGDGTTEVVWGGDDGSVWAWRADGSRVEGFPRRAGTAGRNLRVALGNLDGRPGLEIVVTSNNYAVYGFRGDGTPLPGWPVIIGDEPTAPVIMRFGTNPVPAVVVAAATEIRAFGPTGALRFRRDLPSRIAQDLAAGDLDGDGRDEIVALMDAPDQIASFDSSGAMISYRLLFVHSWGPPLIGPLATGTGAQVLFPSPDSRGHSRYYAFTSTFGDLRGWPKAGQPSRSPSMGNVDGDNATEIAAGSGDDGLIYLYDAGPGTWRPAAAHWTTARANFARTGSRFDAPGITPGDDVGPLAVTDLANDEPGTHDVMLRWPAPGDPGSRPRVDRYDVRASTAPLDASNFGAAVVVTQGLDPGDPGAAESLHVTGLPEGVRHWFALRSRDAEGNWSAVSNVVEIETVTRRPATVEDLRVAGAGDSSLTLAWTATGDDGRLGRPSFYRIRLAEVPLDSASFAAATIGVDARASVDAG
ncbi:MAG: S8 family serine peptidase, partial [Candidatus Eisenbacteria bacterium]